MKRHHLFLFLVILVSSFRFGFAQVAEKEAVINSYEWTFVTYQFPAIDLVGGFASPERGSLRPPSVPDQNADDKTIQDFIKKSSSITSHFLELKGLSLPKGGLLIFDPESLTLSARLPRISQSSVQFTALSYQDVAEKYLSLSLNIFEAPSALVRGWSTRRSLFQIIPNFSQISKKPLQKEK